MKSNTCATSATGRSSSVLCLADSEAKALFDQIIKDHNWDQKKKT